MSNKEHPMSKIAGSVEPAEVKAEDPDSLYSGRPNYWNKRQQQTGMEKKHEQWVMATLNFLQEMQIPFYTRDQYGTRLPKQDKEIPERLRLMQEKYWELERQARNDRTARYDAEARTRRLSSKLVAATDLLVELWQGMEKLGSQEWEDAKIKLQAHLEDERPQLFKEEKTDGE